jgi:hypothetical protein
MGAPAGKGGAAKRRRLLELQREIEDRFHPRPVWFFKTLNGVEGYLGTGPVMFVGQNPCGVAKLHPYLER